MTFRSLSFFPEPIRSNHALQTNLHLVKITPDLTDESCTRMKLAITLIGALAMFVTSAYAGDDEERIRVL